MITKLSQATLRPAKAYPFVTIALVSVLAAFALTLLRHATLASWLLASASALALVVVIVRIWHDTRSGHVSTDILTSVAITAAVVLRHEWTAIALVALLGANDLLTGFATRRAQYELRRRIASTPTFAHLLQKHKTLDVRASAVRPRDTIIVKPQETVPADAQIIEGASSFSELLLTGERQPQPKTTGMLILAGSTNLEQEVTAQAIRTARESQYQQALQLAGAITAHPAPFARLAARYSLPYTAVALTIGGVAWILSGDATRFLDVLVVATPLPLVVATPIALTAAMWSTLTDGIIIKTGAALEKLAEARTLAFGKAGILTNGTPVVDQTVAFSSYTEEEILAYAAALEQDSAHALVQAVTAEASQRNLKLPKVKQIRTIAGRGLEAATKQGTLLAGSLRLIREQAVAAPTSFKPSAVTQPALYLAINGTLAGYITFRDQLRPSAKRSLATLRQLGIRTLFIVTGDSMAAAKAVATKLAIHEVVADASPADKLLTIEDIEHHPAVFVGNGAADAPLLMAADVGIALGARGDTAAGEPADIIILGDGFSLVAQAAALAVRSFRIATGSIILGTALSLLLMFVFATGKFPPIAGVAVQEVINVIVMLNALRAQRPAARPLPKPKG